MSLDTAPARPRDWGGRAVWLLAGLALLLQGTMVMGVLGYWHLPLVCFAAGLIGYRFLPGRTLRLFFFLLPLLPGLADFRFPGYAFNLIALLMFWLGGMLLGARWRGESLEVRFAGRFYYRIFLAVLWLSALFVFLRWSNLTLASRAFLRDTPVNPSQLPLSGALFIPLSTLLLYTLGPAIVPLLRNRGLTAGTVLNAVSGGYLVSLALAAAQSSLLKGFMSEDWWAIERRFNGGFSDYNAFALFSGLLFLFHALRLLEGATGRSRWVSFLFLPATLAGIGLSGTRSALLFVLAALAFFLFRRGIRPVFKVAGLALLAAGFLLLGGTLKKRIDDMIRAPDVLTGGSGTVRMVNFLTNNRLLMVFDSLEMLERFPVSGIGVGNFYNYRDYLHFRGRYYSDLALNQYLQVLDETGVPGLLAFLGFWLALLRRSRPGMPRTLLAVFALALLFSNYLWFPESVLLVFGLISFASPEAAPAAPGKPWPRRALVALLLAGFGMANLAAFNSLHPLSWCAEKKQRYDYGFWEYERAGGQKFRWTRGRCGLYLFPGKPLRFHVVCAVPLHLLPGGRQEVKVFWRGRLQRTLAFTQNGEEVFGVTEQDGFLELEVTPSFTPAGLGYADDTRELGVQLVVSRH